MFSNSSKHTFFSIIFFLNAKFDEVYAYSTGMTFIFVLHCFLMCTASQMRSMASRPRCVILAFFLLLTLASAIRCGSGPEEKLVCRMWKNEYRRKCSDSSTGLICRVLLDRLQTNGCVPSELIFYIYFFLHKNCNKRLIIPKTKRIQQRRRKEKKHTHKRKHKGG